MVWYGKLQLSDERGWHAFALVGVDDALAGAVVRELRHIPFTYFSSHGDFYVNGLIFT